MPAQKFLRNEAHLTLEFLRFEDTGEALVAVIEPKNFVLPYIAHHFCTRFACEKLLVWDKTHAAALVWQGDAAHRAAGGAGSASGKRTGGTVQSAVEALAPYHCHCRARKLGLPPHALPQAVLGPYDRIAGYARRAADWCCAHALKIQALFGGLKIY